MLLTLRGSKAPPPEPKLRGSWGIRKIVRGVVAKNEKITLEEAQRRLAERWEQGG